MYESNGWIKFSEIDNWKDGCEPKTTSSQYGNDHFKCDNVQGLIEDLKDFCGCEDNSNVLINSCDEIGRVDIQIMEDDNSTPASKEDMRQWKKGKKRLWLSCYTFYVEEVTRKEVDLSKFNTEGYTAN